MMDLNFSVITWYSYSKMQSSILIYISSRGDFSVMTVKTMNQGKLT